MTAAKRLRLGFFTDAISAKQVAYYVRSEFSSVAVVPVSPQEKSRATDQDVVIMAAAVGGFSAWFRPAGMARTMLGVAIMQALLGVAIATEPSIASIPEGPLKALLFSAGLAAL